MLQNDDDLWRKNFIGTKEHFFRNTIYCTFNPIRLILYKRANVKWIISHIKDKIFATYEKYFNTDQFNTIMANRKFF